jgi:nucleoside 2-deoxyribosyltransferase
LVHILNIYIAGPLFSESEIRYNLELDKFLNSLGYGTFLPQRDGFKLFDLLSKGISPSEAINTIFQKDLDVLRKSDIIVIILDGRVPDEGACIEIGFGYALGKECVGIKTDSRSLMDNLDNPLITGTLNNRIARNFEELRNVLADITRKYDRDNT